MRNTFRTNNGNLIVRRSRWIQLHHDYVTKKHSLFEYADDNENPGTEGLLVWFRHKRKYYALGQFMRFNKNEYFEDNGKRCSIGGYDCTQYYKPYLIEINDSGEAIRLYQYVEVE